MIPPKFTLEKQWVYWASFQSADEGLPKGVQVLLTPAGCTWEAFGSKDHGLPASAQMEVLYLVFPGYVLELFPTPSAMKAELHSTLVGSSGYSGDICDPSHPSTRDKTVNRPSWGTLFLRGQRWISKMVAAGLEESHSESSLDIIAMEYKNALDVHGERGV